MKYIFLILLLIGEFSIAATSNQHQVRVFFSASSESMEPAIKKSEVIFNSPYEDGQSPRRGDVVVFNYPDNNGFTYVKRVIGLPGERVEIRGGLVYVNGSRLEEPYLFHVKEDAVPDLKRQFSDVFDMNEKIIPEKNYFLLGDNRYNSLDSRIFGPVGDGDILGVAVPWHEIEKDEIRIGAALARYVFEVNKALPMKFEDGAIFQSVSQDGNTVVVFNFKYLRGLVFQVCAKLI